MNKLLKLSYIFLIFCLFFYSYTQVDLSLTFSRIAILRQIISSFQYIGYFNRPLSSVLYISLLILLTAFYICFIRKAIKGQLEKKRVWITILITAGILIAFRIK